MKIIHFADLHIGSKFERMPDNVKENLITKLRNSFFLIVDFARNNGINTVLMAGDIFDRDSVTMSDKKFFYDTIRLNSDIDFYYIKGNHDSNSKYNDVILNLHTFDGVSSYVKNNVRIIGYELRDDNSLLYNYPPFTRDKYNIMMLHGDINNSNDKNYIDLKKLDNKNIDYFALGHIHKRNDGYLSKARFSYPGCVFGRGFDELGEKGFLVLDTDTNSLEFQALADIMFENIEVDVSTTNESVLKQEIKAKLDGVNDKLITEIKLVGKSSFLIDTEDLKRTFEDYRYYLEVKNKAKLILKYVPSENENSLRNMFINKVLSDSTIDDDMKEKVISYGLSKLMKEE